MSECKRCEEKEKGMMAGQGFREFTCQLCGKTDVWHNTNTPRFCSECSKRLNMCQRCGNPLDNVQE